MADRIETLNTAINQLRVDLNNSRNDNEDLQRRNNDFKEYNNELLDKLSDAELEKESIIDERDEVVSVSMELERQLQAAKSVIDNQNKELEALRKEMTSRETVSVSKEDQYVMFSRLMDSFEKERMEWRRKNSALQHLLKSATSDIMYLTKKNEAVQDALKEAVVWEAGIQPSRYDPSRNHLRGGGAVVGSASSTASSSSGTERPQQY